MARVRDNLIANLGGATWATIVSIAFVPIYIRILGVEAYGLLGILVTLQATLSFLDLGLSTTLTRELARLSVQPSGARIMRDLVRTLEVVYWLVAAAMGLFVIAVAPWIAHQWIQSSHIPPSTVQRAIVIMGLSIALQWPQSLYNGGLSGLQRQVLLSGLNAFLATVRSGGAVLVLWFISPTVEAFFVWQLVSSALATLAGWWSLWRALPPAADARGARTSLELLRGVWRFAAGNTGITITGLILTQTDKVTLSRLLSLEMFGYYMIAVTATTVVQRVVGPVFTALYPRFTQLLSLGDEAALSSLYHRSSQMMAVLILPLTCMMAVYSKEILFLWTRDRVVAERTALILTLLVIGRALNGLVHVPAALQLAFGWTSLGLYINLVSVTLLVPMIVILASRYGAVGAAAAWVLLNVGYVAISVSVMHRRILLRERSQWYVWDFGIPLLATALACGVGRFWIDISLNRTVLFASLMGMSAFAVMACLSVTPVFTKSVIGQCRRVVVPVVT
jgi:O-antigen/teichoic acid export membrane protein